jgi:hypothetical protein
VQFDVHINCQILQVPKSDSFPKIDNKILYMHLFTTTCFGYQIRPSPGSTAISYKEVN